MAKRYKTANYYAYLQRTEEQRALSTFCDNLSENLVAIVAPKGIDRFAGLVVTAHEYNEMISADNNYLKLLRDDPSAEPDVLGEAVIDSALLFDHPQTRESETKIDALKSAHQAYLGSLAMERIQDAS